MSKVFKVKAWGKSGKPVKSSGTSPKKQKSTSKGESKAPKTDKSKQSTTRSTRAKSPGIGRAVYAVFALPVLLLQGLLFFAILSIGNSFFGVLLGVILGVIFLALTIFLLAATVERLDNIGLRGWWALLLIVPWIQSLFLLFCVFAPAETFKRSGK